MWQRPDGLWGLRYLLSGPLQKKLADSYSRKLYVCQKNHLNSTLKRILPFLKIWITKLRGNKQINCIPGHWTFTAGCENKFFSSNLMSQKPKHFWREGGKLKQMNDGNVKAALFSRPTRFCPAVSIPLRWCRSETQRHRPGETRQQHPDGEGTLAGRSEKSYSWTRQWAWPGSATERTSQLNRDGNVPLFLQAVVSLWLQVSRFFASSLLRWGAGHPDPILVRFKRNAQHCVYL